MSQEVYFENIRSIIKSELLNAQEFIYIAVAWLTDDELFQCLVDLSQKGINIQLLINDDLINQNSGLDYLILYKNGGLIFYIEDQDNLMHNKFCIIDNKTVLNGSYNWTNKAKVNHENITVTDDPNVCSKFLEQFTKLKNEAVKYTGVINEDIESISQATDSPVLTFEQYLSRAKKRKKNENYLACQHDLQSAIKLEPDKKEMVLFDLALCQYYLGNYKASLANISSYLEFNPTSSEALNNRGLVYQELKEFRLGIDDFSKAIELEPSEHLYFKNRADIQQELIKYFKNREKRPKSNYTKEVEKKDKTRYIRDEEIHFWFNSNLEKLIFRSIKDYLVVLKEDPECDKADIYLQIAETYYDLNRFEDSISYYTRSISNDSKNAYSFYCRGLSFYILENFDRAINDIDKAITIEPNNSAYKDLRLRIKKEKRKFKNWFK